MHACVSCGGPHIGMPDLCLECCYWLLPWEVLSEPELHVQPAALVGAALWARQLHTQQKQQQQQQS
jgi:hypothetical protein